MLRFWFRFSVFFWWFCWIRFDRSEILFLPINVFEFAVHQLLLSSFSFVNRLALFSEQRSMADPSKYGGITASPLASSSAAAESETVSNSALPATHITADQWAQFDKLGFVHLGKVIPEDIMCRIDQRATDLMMGRVQ